jgi:pimeloyl-ACP methyl ester carboxylesterase
MKLPTRRVLTRPLVLICLALLILLGRPCAAQGSGSVANQGLTESLHRVALKRGVDLNLLVNQRIGTSPSIAVLLFAGYPGILQLREEGGALVHGMGGNFLIRARRFLNTDQVFTVAVDCPMDEWNHCGDLYRTSAQHVGDVAEAIAAIREKYGARQVYVVGTSYGTVSTSFLAAALEGQIDGAIHTATMTDPPHRPDAHGVAMARFDWSQARVPQLFIHHKDDPCIATRYRSVVARRGAVPLITVQGAVDIRGDACQARTQHGFAGRERETMAALHDWVTARKLPAVVGEP